jgi:DNA-binding XRE family transcriptional regulator
MARNFKELQAKMSPAARTRSEERARKMEEDLALNDLRAARELTQTQMAELLDVSQSEISKIEKRTDMYVSTLASYIAAMGGTLEIRAIFPEGDVRIKRFDEIAER